MFRAALLKIAKAWKQPRYHSVGGWIIKTVVHPYNGTLFSDKKK